MAELSELRKFMYEVGAKRVEHPVRRAVLGVLETINDLEELLGDHEYLLEGTK